MKDLTVIEALCILNCGWANDIEKELTNKVQDKIEKISKKLHLEFKKDKIEKEINSLT